MNRPKWISPTKSKKLILFGAGDLASIAYEYFSGDSEYEVAAFTVDREYIKEKEFCGLPIIPFDEINEKYPPSEYEIHICVVYDRLNRIREAKCDHAKHKGYSLASYISSYAFVSPSAEIGEHCFIFEDNTIQPNVTVGDNVIMWSGNHVGHHSVVGKNVFLSSHVVVSGHCNIGDNTFIGVNSTLANNVMIGKYSWISHGSIISKDVPPNSFVKSTSGLAVTLNEEVLFRSLDRARK